MGTWDDGLLDNDTALDGLGELEDVILADVRALGGRVPSPDTTAELAAAIGVYLQLASEGLDPGDTNRPVLVTALGAHAEELTKLPREAQDVLGAISRGEAVAGKPAELPAEAVRLLAAGADSAPFHAPIRGLSAAKRGAAYVQSVANRCAQMIDEDLEDEDTAADLAREGLGIAALGVLLVLPPYALSTKRTKAWRRAVKNGLAALVSAEDDELDFHRGYYANVLGVIDLVEKRLAD
jgi:hypothetical protein